MEGPLAYRETLTIEHQLGELGWYGGPTIDPDEAQYERISSRDSTQSLEPKPETQPIVSNALTQFKVSNTLGRRVSKYGKKAMQGLFNMHKRARVDDSNVERGRVKHQKKNNVSFPQILTLRFKL